MADGEAQFSRGFPGFCQRDARVVLDPLVVLGGSQAIAQHPGDGAGTDPPP